MKNSQSLKKGSICDIFSNKKLRAHYFSDRCIMANENRLDYPNNLISTGKYTVFTFLPKNLFFQFSKLANDYFVVIGLLQLVKEISTSNGIPYVFLPLSVIIIVTMLKDLAEDYGRHKSDREENNKPTKVFRNGKFVPAKWSDLRVGNIVMVEEDQFFPADLLVLKSSGKKGLCFVETKNLDGETNLKQKQAHKDITSDFDTNEKWNKKKQIARATNLIKYEKANDYIYKFIGSIETTTGVVSLGEPNLVLRGSSLRNTEYIIGLVCYTGHHTKIMLNSIKAKPKLSRLEKAMNRQILLVFFIQLCFCVFAALYSALWYSRTKVAFLLFNELISYKDDLPYLSIDQTGSKDNTFVYNFFIRFGNWVLLLNGLVPISLLVTLEMVKVCQGIYMVFDAPMTTTTTKVKTTVQSSNLNEELGQVDYIFSDKTGTLTQNLMEFKNLSVKHRSYGDLRTLSDTKGMPQVTNVDFLDKSFFDELNNPKSSNYENIIECLTLLAVCHTTMTEEKGGQIIYNASSPDELALVNFAKFVGCEFLGTDDNNNIRINLRGKILSFQLLHVLEFSSARKRMSVIVKLQDGKIVLYTKGADTILLERMNKNDPAIVTTQEHLYTYATKGLRTLLLAKKVLDTMAYTNWAKRYQEACVKIEGRDDAMEELQSEIEQDLRLVGATAIEDKLQDEVGITISKLKEAGIKVWVLTGDKVETAINIGYSCKLLDNTLTQLIVAERSFSEVNSSLDKKIDIIQRSRSDQANFALIISGDALIHAMKPELSKKIMIIAENCKAVLACRVSPKQKQEIVALVRKEKPTATTLAIGDGANDVYMITAANVGVGIRGVEGQQLIGQAARASDFAIGEFKILRRLLLFHGREAYRRNSYLILYNFYKNIVLLLPQFWYGFVTGFSGRFIFEQITFQFYNIFFTSLPVIIYAVFDQEHKDSTLVNTPLLYVQGMTSIFSYLSSLIFLQDQLFNTYKFCKWLSLAIWESVVLGVVAFASVGNNFSSGTHGRMFDSFGPGMFVFSTAVWLANFKIITMCNTYTPLNLIVIFGSMLVFVVMYVIINLMSFSEVYKQFGPLFSTGNFYIGSILVVIISAFSFMAHSRHDKLVEMDLQGKVSPTELEVQKLLDGAGSVIHLDVPTIKSRRKNSADSSENRSSLEFESGALLKTKLGNPSILSDKERILPKENH